VKVRKGKRKEKGSSGKPAPGDEPQVVELDEAQLGQLSAVFSAPRWLRELGLASWLLAGVTRQRVAV